MRAYPPKYAKVKAWAKGLQFITLSLMEREFNLRYKESRRILFALQDDGVISSYGNPKGEYRTNGQLWGN